MRRRSGFILWTFLAAAALAQMHEPASPLGPSSSHTGLLLTDSAVIQLINHSSGDLAYQGVAQLAMWSRVVASGPYEKAAEWVAQKAGDAGLEDAHIEHFPADGTTRFFESTSPRFWKVRGGELLLTSPFHAKITSYAELPVSLCRNSVSANVEAEFVDIGSGMEDGDYRNPVKGKVVLTSSDPAAVVSRAVHKEGALGIVSYWSIPEWDRTNRLPGEYSDLVGWRYLPDPGQKPGTFAFMISPRQAAELQHMLRSKDPVRVRAKVDADLTPGSLSVVTAVIRGSKYPGEEIMVTAHLDEIGADDNASGSASLLEMGRTLKELIASGQMPPPLRTIRFIWGPEFAGNLAWLSRHLKDPVKRVADLNYDEIGANLRNANAVLNVSYTPDSVPSYLNALAESIFLFLNQYNDLSNPPRKDFHVVSVNGTRDRLNARMIPFIGGSDSIVYNNLGVPAIFVVAWPESFYHSSKDTPDKLDPTQLHRCIFSGLAAMTTIAYADDPDSVDLALMTFARARERIGQGEATAFRRIVDGSAGNLAEYAHRADCIVHHVYQREQAAVRSCAFFARTPAARQAIEQIALTLSEGEDRSRKQVRELGVRKAESRGGVFQEYKPDAAEQRAARLIPARRPNQELLGTEFVFGKMKSDSAVQVNAVRQELLRAEKVLRLQGDGDLRILGLADEPASYADGHRSLLDIRNDLAAEYTPLSLEALELYFRLFEKAGVMTIAEK